MGSASYLSVLLVHDVGLTASPLASSSVYSLVVGACISDWWSQLMLMLSITTLIQYSTQDADNVFLNSL